MFSYVASYGKPHAEAGARELDPPRLNDGKLPRNGDDNANNTWFDTAENSRIHVDLGKSTNIARINVYSWHSGALSPQQYTLWAADRDAPTNAKPADLANDWQEASTDRVLMASKTRADTARSGSTVIYCSTYRRIDRTGAAVASSLKSTSIKLVASWKRSRSCNENAEPAARR